MGLKRLLDLVLDFTSICGNAFRIFQKPNMRRIRIQFRPSWLLDSGFIFSCITHNLYGGERNRMNCNSKLKSIFIRQTYMF